MFILLQHGLDSLADVQVYFSVLYAIPSSVLSLMLHHTDCNIFLLRFRLATINIFHFDLLDLLPFLLNFKMSLLGSMYKVAQF